MKESNLYFIYVGNAYPHKNLKRLIEAMVILNKKVSQDIKLYIVSSRNVFTKSLEKLVEKLKAKDYIKLLGFVPDEELAYYYQNCLAYIICNEEDFGISPIEAFSFGKPVLAFKLGGAAETNLKGVTLKFF